jgi:hypothetical protein
MKTAIFHNMLMRERVQRVDLVGDDLLDLTALSVF